MIEKPLIIIIFMYGTSFMLLGAQFVLGDVFGIELANWEGTPIKSTILDTVDTDQLNTSAQNIIGTNQTSVTQDPISAAAGIAWEVFTLLTGTYVFQVLYLLGVPSIIVAGMVIIYIIMLSRTIIAYLRGI